MIPSGSGDNVQRSAGRVSGVPTSVQGDSSTPEGGGSIVRVLMLGAGGHARVIADAILSRAMKRKGLEVVGFLDDNPDLLQTRILGRPVLGQLSALASIPHDAVVIGIGDNETRSSLFEELSSRGEKFLTVVHPQACIAHDVRVGVGTVVFAGVVVNAGTTIANNVILNTGCTVDHDCRVDSHAHVCPGAHLGGTVRVGEGAFVGIASTIIHNVTVGEWSTIGAGAAVIRDVPARRTVVGVPAKELPPKPFRQKPDTRDIGLAITLGGETGDVEDVPGGVVLRDDRGIVLSGKEKIVHVPEEKVGVVPGSLRFGAAGRDIVVQDHTKIVNPESITLGDHVRIDDFVLLISGVRTSIGSYTHIGAYSSITGGGEFELGDFAGLSFGVRVFTGNEDFSGESFTNSTIPFPYRHPRRGHVRIGKFAVVGSNTVVLPGVTIGEGCVIGANSLVTRDCQPWTVYHGNPVRAIKRRPSEWLIAKEREVRRFENKED